MEFPYVPRHPHRLLDPDYGSAVRVQRYCMTIPRVGQVGDETIFEASPHIVLRPERIVVPPIEAVDVPSRWLRAVWFLLSWVRYPWLVKEIDYDADDETWDGDVTPLRWRVRWQRPIEKWWDRWYADARVRAYAGCRVTSIEMLGVEQLTLPLPVAFFSATAVGLQLDLPTLPIGSKIRIRTKGEHGHPAFISVMGPGFGTARDVENPFNG